MKAEDKLQIGKFLFMLINSLFVILGISLFGSSLWILFDNSSVITVLSSETDLKVAAGGLFVIGLVVVGVSMLGCIGVHLENRCFIATYMGFLIAIILGELFITFLLLLKQSQIEAFLTASVDAIISSYGVNSTQSTWSLLDRVQQSAKCCGRQNASDWETNTFIQLQNMTDIYPCSCFNGSCPTLLAYERYQFGNGTHIYTTGCEEKLKDWFKSNVFVIVGMSLALLFIQILQFILGLSICRTTVHKIRDKQPENLLDEMEENPPSCSEPQQNDLDRTHQPVHDVYDQGRSYHQDPDPQPQHRRDIPAYDPRRNDGYDGVGNDQHESQMYQHHRGSVQNRYIYNQRPVDGSTQQYNNQFQDRRYGYDRDLQHRQSYNGNYNRGYDHDITY